MMNLTVFPEFCELLIQHSQRYPDWEMQDLYKLLFQAAMGCEHDYSNWEQVRERLHDEIEEMGEGPNEPVLDPISPDGAIYRVHLRPYIRTALDLEELLESFRSTASGYKSSIANLKCYCHDALELTQSGQLPFNKEELSAYFQLMEKNGFPPVHHSEKYRQKYRPAYRVVAWGA